MHNPESVLNSETYKPLWAFEIKINDLISARQSNLVIVNKKKRTCNIVDLALPADLRLKVKESEKKDRYLEFARELKRLWKLKVTIMPVIFGLLSRITKEIAKRLEELKIRARVETNHTTMSLRSARILWRILETSGDLLSLRLHWQFLG